MLRTIEFYEVSDCFTEDGRGPTTVIGRITDQGEANKYAYKRGNYGQDAHVRKVNLIIVDTANEMKEYDKQEKRQLALAKLTDEERVLLGIK
jgi:hypothetical protein